MAQLDELLSAIEASREYIIKLYRKLIPLKAIPPDFGGEGELERAEAIIEELRALGLEPQRYDAPDERAKGGVRPNIIVRIGEGKPRLWIISHLDTVPEGDLKLWKYPPYEATIEDDRVYGRGAEDNLQAVVATLTLLKAIVDTGFKPRFSLIAAFVSDEEAGSKYGVRYLLEQRDLFRGNDWVIVPDYCSPRGEYVEVAEKHILWFKVVVEGKQVHASTPERGLNAHRLGMMLNLEIDKVLHEKFTAVDGIFDPPVSTFEPTRKEENVGNINTVPGRDVVYWDARILPKYSIEEVASTVEAIVRWFSTRYGCKASVEYVMKDAAGEPTPVNHPLVQLLREAVREDRGIDVKPVGIGGGTVARYFRKRGIPAIVWQTCELTAHQPNEYARISNVVADARVFARIVYAISSKR